MKCAYCGQSLENYQSYYEIDGKPWCNWCASQSHVKIGLTNIVVKKVTKEVD